MLLHILFFVFSSAILQQAYTPPVTQRNMDTNDLPRLINICHKVSS